jgi:hypothetical protein
MTESHYAEMKNFVDHNSDSGWSKARMALVNKLKTEMKYYEKVKSLKDSEAKAVVVDSFEGRVPSQQNFLDNFRKFYNAESVKEPQQQNLVFLLLQALLEKLNGNSRAQYGEKLLNFYLVVHSMSPKASEFVTANLPGVSKRQIQRVSSK